MEVLCTHTLPQQCLLRAPLRLGVMAHDTAIYQHTCQFPQHVLMGDITSVLALDHLQHRLHQVTKQETSCIILKAEDNNGSDVFRLTNDLPVKTALEPEREQEKGQTKYKEWQGEPST